MLTFTQKIIQNLSNKVSTLNFSQQSHLLPPNVNINDISKNSSISKSINALDNDYSISYDGHNYSNIQQNLARSRRSKQSIQLKRQIIRKMNIKILNLQKTTKNKKVDSYELQAFKNDLLIDFLQYQKSKRKHEQQINQAAIQQEQKQLLQQKSFFFMKNQSNQHQLQYKQLSNIQNHNRNNKYHFNKSHMKIKSYANQNCYTTQSILQKQKQYQSTMQKKQSIVKQSQNIIYQNQKNANNKEIQKQQYVFKYQPICVPITMLQFIDVQIPLINMNLNSCYKNKSTTDKLTTQIRQNQTQNYFNSIADQIQNHQNNQYQSNNQIPNLNLNLSISQKNSIKQRQYGDLHLHLNSSRSQICLNQGRVYQLNSQRSDKSINYRKALKSDRFFVQQQQEIQNIKQRDEVEQENKMEQQLQLQRLSKKSHDNNRHGHHWFNSNSNKSIDQLIKSQEIFQKRNSNKNNNNKNTSELLNNSVCSKNNKKIYQSSNLSDKILNYNKFDHDKINSILLHSIQTAKSKSKQNKNQNTYNNNYQQQLVHNANSQQLKLQSIIYHQPILPHHQTQIHHLTQTIHQLHQQLQCKTNKIQSLNQTLQHMQNKISQLQKQLTLIQKASSQHQQKLMQQISYLSNQLQSKCQQLSLNIQSIQVFQHKSYQKQKMLLKQIQLLQQHVKKSKQQIQFYKKRFKQQGITLNYIQVEMIEQQLQNRQKSFIQEINKIKEIFDKEIGQLKQNKCMNEEEIYKLKVKSELLEKENQEIMVLKQTIQTYEKDNTKIINQKLTKWQQTFKQKQQKYIKQIIDMYDTQLQTRDNQIIQLKQDILQLQTFLKQLLQQKQKLQHQFQQYKTNVLIEKQQQKSQVQEYKIREQSYLTKQEMQTSNLIDHKEEEMRQKQLMIDLLVQKNKKLEMALVKQRQFQQQLQQKLVKLDKLICQQRKKSSGENKSKQNYTPNSSLKNTINNNQLLQQQQKPFQQQSLQYTLIQTLTNQLQKQKQLNKRLKSKLQQQKPLSPPSNQNKLISTLKQKVKKLTKYSKILQTQIKTIYKVDECQAHSTIIKRMEEQLNSYKEEDNKIEVIVQ